MPPSRSRRTASDFSGAKYLLEPSKWVMNAVLRGAPADGYYVPPNECQVLDLSPHPRHRGINCVLNDGVHTISATITEEAADAWRSEAQTTDLRRLANTIIHPDTHEGQAQPNRHCSIGMNERLGQFFLEVRCFTWIHRIQPPDGVGTTIYGKPTCVMEHPAVASLFARVREVAHRPAIPSMPASAVPPPAPPVAPPVAPAGAPPAPPAGYLYQLQHYSTPQQCAAFPVLAARPHRVMGELICMSDSDAAALADALGEEAASSVTASATPSHGTSSSATPPDTSSGRATSSATSSSLGGGAGGDGEEGGASLDASQMPPPPPRPPGNAAQVPVAVAVEAAEAAAEAELIKEAEEAAAEAAAEEEMEWGEGQPCTQAGEALPCTQAGEGEPASQAEPASQFAAEACDAFGQAVEEESREAELEAVEEEEAAEAYMPLTQLPLTQMGATEAQHEARDEAHSEAQASLSPVDGNVRPLRSSLKRPRTLARSPAAADRRISDAQPLQPPAAPAQPPEARDDAASALWPLTCPRCRQQCGDVHVALARPLPFHTDEDVSPPDVLGLWAVDAAAVWRGELAGAGDAADEGGASAL